MEVVSPRSGAEGESECNGAGGRHHQEDDRRVVVCFTISGDPHLHNDIPLSYGASVDRPIRINPQSDEHRDTFLGRARPIGVTQVPFQ